MQCNVRGNYKLRTEIAYLSYYRVLISKLSDEEKARQNLHNFELYDTRLFIIIVKFNK